jgi:hypothetical protein
MKSFLSIILVLISWVSFAQNFVYSGYIYNADGSGASNVPIKVYRRTTPNIVGFTQQTNYNGHSYYRSTGSMTWTNAKVACENMGGHLATISNSAENSFLFNTWPSGWIGYYQDKVPGYTYSEPAGGYRWTEIKVTNGLSADYDVSSYTSGSSTLNDIVSSVNSTLYNSPTYSSTGGKYITFNGINQYAITNNLSSKFIDEKISIVAWVYPTGNGVILSELNLPNASSGWHESVIEITGNNTLRVGLWNGLGITQLNTPISLNTWNMICITYNGTTMKGYLNNVNFGSVNFNRSTAFLDGGNGQQHFAFGLSDATNMGHGGFGKFRLGDIQFFNRDITADEIDRTFNLYAYRYRTNQFTFWNGGEPNNAGGEDYAQFVSNGRWNDLPNASLPYVLEFDYIVTATDWLLHTTVYTNSNGYYSINISSDPSREHYIQIDCPTPTQVLSDDDGKKISDIIFGKFPLNGMVFHRFDLNNDGKINVSDQFLLFGMKSGLTPLWSVPRSRIFTQTQFNSITNSNGNVWLTYPGSNSIVTTTLTNGGSQNFYIISPGYSGKVNF